jgi:hypothetical protein
MDIEVNNQCAAVVEPKNKKPEMPLRYQLEMELLANQNSRLFDQRNKLLDMVERLQSKEHEPFKPTAKIEMIQTPAGHIQVGDVIGYDRSNKRIRFGTVTRLTKDGIIYLTHSYSVAFGSDNKQAIYQSMDVSIEQYRVCQVL